MKTPLIALLFILLTQTLASCSQKRIETTPEPQYTTELSNTRWVVQELNAVPTTPDKFEREPYLQLRDGESDDKKMTGFGGCNQLQSNYTSSINNLTFGPIMSTRRYCAQMEFETSFTMVLGDTDSFKIVEDLLYLYKGENLLAVLKAMYYQ